MFSVQREFYKLILVFMMILLSFSVAFFLGREMSLWDYQKRQASRPSPPPQPEQALPPGADRSENPPPPEDFSHRQRVLSYQNVLAAKGNNIPLPKPEDESPPGEGEINPGAEKKETLKSAPLYALLIARSETKTGAVDKSSQIKMRFPQWNIFFKWVEGQYRVYIGPFKEEEAAREFLKDMQDRKTEFEILKLEELPEKKKDQES